MADIQEWSQTVSPASMQNPLVLYNQVIGVKPVRSVTILNSTTGTIVSVYRNAQEAPTGVPYVTVLPGAAMTLPMTVFEGVTLFVAAQAGKQLDGTVSIHLTNQVLSASGTAGLSSGISTPGGGSGGGVLSRIFGVAPIVASQSQVGGPYDTVGFPMFHLGSGSPAIIAPVGDLYVDQANGNLWQCKVFHAGAPGLHTLQLGDNARNLYALDDASGTAAKDSASTLDALYQNGVVLNQPPLQGDRTGCAKFVASSNSNVLLPFVNAMSTTAYDNSAPFSLEFLWKNIGPSASGGGGVLGNSIGNITYGFACRADGKDLFSMGTSFNGFVADGTIVHHFVLTYTGTSGDNTTRYYVDGALYQSNSGNHEMGFAPQAGDKQTIGALWYPGDSAWHNAFDGYVQSVAFYSGPLSATQVLAHYNAIPNVGSSLWKQFQQI